MLLRRIITLGACVKMSQGEMCCGCTWNRG